MSGRVRSVRIDRLVLRNVDVAGGAGLERMIAEELADHEGRGASERLTLPAGAADREVAHRVAAEIRTRAAPR